MRMQKNFSLEDWLTLLSAQVQYQVAVIEEGFEGALLANNECLIAVQKMGMTLRRHSFVILIGESFESWNPKQAFTQIVHIVLNPKDLVELFGPSIQQKMGENDLFLRMYRDVWTAVSQGK